MKKYSININDIKNIIRSLNVEDCFAGPELDRNDEYGGLIFKFSPFYDKIKLYIKIRIENYEKAVCISIHEFGKYDEVK